MMTPFNYFKQYGLNPGGDFAYSITLPKHAEQQGKRDPRKVWMYDTMGGKWSAVPDYHGSEVTYYFEKEVDFMVFTLRWEGK